MKLLLPLFALVALAGCETQHKMNACFGATVQQAFAGDFSGWVLPEFIPGRHMRAGQYLTPNCEIAGKPR